MPPSTRITELATLIHNGTLDIDAHLQASGQPTPSFEVNTPAKVDLPDGLARTRENVVEAMDELRALLQGPVNTLVRLSSPIMNTTIALQAIYRFNLPSHIPLNEPVSYATLSKLTSVPETDLKRLMRLAISHRIFQEPSPDVVAHTALSQALKQNPQLLSLVGFITEEIWSSSSRVVDAMQKWPESEEPEHTGFSLANGGETKFADALQTNPERVKRFRDTMAAVQSTPEFSIDHLLDSLHWDSPDEDFHPELVVDVGGSQGAVSNAMLRRFEDVRCVVEDKPEVLSSLKAPAKLLSRLSYVGHDLFNAQPVKGADVYLFRGVLRDWSDKYAVMILRNQIPALKRGARILINDICMPEPGEVGRSKEQFLRGYDMVLKSELNAKERSASEWAALFAAADERFKVLRSETPPGSILGIVEAVWEGEAYESRGRNQGRFVVLNTKAEALNVPVKGPLVGEIGQEYDSSKIRPMMNSKWLSNAH